jgi:hypothetical protein
MKSDIDIWIQGRINPKTGYAVNCRLSPDLEAAVCVTAGLACLAYMLTPGRPTWYTYCLDQRVKLDDSFSHALFHSIRFWDSLPTDFEARDWLDYLAPLVVETVGKDSQDWPKQLKPGLNWLGLADEEP